MLRSPIGAGRRLPVVSVWGSTNPKYFCRRVPRSGTARLLGAAEAETPGGIEVMPEKKLSSLPTSGLLDNEEVPAKGTDVPEIQKV